MTLGTCIHGGLAGEYSGAVLAQSTTDTRERE